MHVCTHTLVSKKKTSDYNNRPVGSMQYKATSQNKLSMGQEFQIKYDLSTVSNSRWLNTPINALL